MGNDLSSLLFPFTSPHCTVGSLPCEISQIGQTVVAYPDRRSAEEAWRRRAVVQGATTTFGKIHSFIPKCQADAGTAVSFLCDGLTGIAFWFPICMELPVSKITSLTG